MGTNLSNNKFKIKKIKSGKLDFQKHTSAKSPPNQKNHCEILLEYFDGRNTSFALRVALTSLSYPLQLSMFLQG